MQQPHRTQIYLPSDLRREIDKDRLNQKESLAEYLRKAAQERLARSKKKKADLKRLARDFIGSSKKTDAEVQEWLDWVREERKRSDRFKE